MVLLLGLFQIEMVFSFKVKSVKYIQNIKYIKNKYSIQELDIK